MLVGYRSSAEGPELAERIGGTAGAARRRGPRRRRGDGRGLGTLDILVNNAGVDDMAFFTEYTPERWRPQLDVNLEGVLHCTLARAARDAGGALRPHRQRLLRGGPAGLLPRLGLRRREGRGDRLHEVDRAREREASGSPPTTCCRDRSRPRCWSENRHGPKGEQVIEAMARRNPARTGSASRRRWRPRSRSSPPIAAPTSPVRRSASRAEWGWERELRASWPT